MWKRKRLRHRLTDEQRRRREEKIAERRAERERPKIYEK